MRLSSETNCNCNTAWADTWYKDIAPRIGFAYVLPGTNNKAVIRAGGAILYGPLQYNDFGSSMSLGVQRVARFRSRSNTYYRRRIYSGLPSGLKLAGRSHQLNSWLPQCELRSES